jgi:hypothetical protein
MEDQYALEGRLPGLDDTTPVGMVSMTPYSVGVKKREAFAGLKDYGAVAIMLYQGSRPDPTANDIWPTLRTAAKVPAQYYLLKDESLSSENRGAVSNITFPNHPQSFYRGSAVKTMDQPDGLASPSTPRWPPGRLPTELYEAIAGHLNRDDIKSMRLVCREFDRHVSQVLFKTVVVPFNIEVYGMLGKEKQVQNGKNFGKNLFWKDNNEDDVYNGHGLDVFKGFGKHIRRFGMSFEVNEDLLANPPDKTMTERHMSFWGGYDWPFEEYRRFDDVAGLETAADETPRMTVAFSELTNVRELALSIDSGLGWLNGPDRSIRARILNKPPSVFGNMKEDRRAKAQRELWDHIESHHRTRQDDVKHASLYNAEISRVCMEQHKASNLAERQPDIPFLDPNLVQQAIPHIPGVHPPEDDPSLDRFVLTPSATGTGVLYTSTSRRADRAQLLSPIIPTNLTKPQKEWLLETEWAQRAFLSSYMLSVIDNPTTFDCVHTLTVSRLSDRYLPMLNRQDFWDGLPHLETLVLRVIPGWRDVYKDEAGFVETVNIRPDRAIDAFHGILPSIGQRSNIKRLTIGWACGGEHAEGLHARNKLLFPSPLLPSSKATVDDKSVIDDALLELPYVEEITLENCWMTPIVLERFVERHDKLSMTDLCLDSVSLTAVLVDPGNANNGPNNGQPGHLHFGIPVVGLQPVGFAAAGGVPQVGFHGAGNLQMPQAPQPPVNLPNGYQAFMQFHIQTLGLQVQQLQAQGGGQAQVQVFQLQAQLQSMQAQLQTMQQLNAQMQPGQQNPFFSQVQQHHHLQVQPNPNATIQPQLPFQNQQLFVQNPQPLVQNQQPVAQNQPVLPAPPIPNPRTTLHDRPREGSWLSVLDIISPGVNLTDFGSEFSQADSERQTSLECITFKSCGYARLPHSPHNQQAIGEWSSGMDPVLSAKANVLGPAMLSAKWVLLGEIIQNVDREELAALHAGWDLETGWRDAEAARGSEFDGLLPGGTGRFSGVVRRRAADGDEDVNRVE